MGEKCAFIDDTGDSGFSFEKPGTSSHFILGAVIIDKSSLPDIRNAVEVVREKYFQRGEMKSSKVGKNDARRLRILTDLVKIPFHILFFVVNKKRLYQSSGLKYHDSFMKFLSKHIYNELYVFNRDTDVCADEHSDEVFRESFKDYILRQVKPTLFSNYSVDTRPSKDDVMLQLADFLTGTMARGYEEKNKSKQFKDFMRVIQANIIKQSDFPGDYSRYLNTVSSSGIQYNADIAGFAVRLADKFITENECSPLLDIHNQVGFLQHLLFHLEFNRPDWYVSTKVIRNHLHIQNVYYLRSKIVAPLRDKGVLIASSSKGYKIPISEDELNQSCRHQMMMVGPMIGRLMKCHEQVLFATSNQLDILKQNEYSLLHPLLGIKEER